jgi:hypothetical protein
MTLERAALLSLAASLALLLATPAVAEEWKYDLELYLLAAGIEGTAGAGPQEAEINLSFSEIFEDLELGGMGLFRARKGRWGMLGDVIFVSLESTEEVAVVEEDQLILEGLGIYMVTDRIGLVFGGRYVDLETRIELRGPLRLRASAGDSWVDPLVGLGVEAPMSEKWTFSGRFDVGGFGVGSDLSYQLKLNFGYRPSERYSLRLGYGLLDIDYEDGTGADRFLYDVRMSGPTVGFVFHF